ncbi:PH domain-containing protein [Myxococcota bacterium]|nr:PH domain-containing protein [Myxococcota bacterium]MBU1537928.1 PH domain-containing protein [Myxococcota bacterium]
MAQDNNVQQFFATAIPFGLALGVVVWLTGDPVSGVFAGIAGGILFAIMLIRFQKAQAQKLSIKGPSYEGKAIIYQGAANHFIGMESRGGWLILTEKALYFKSHQHNINKSDCTVPLVDITDVKPSNTLGLIPNGITVTHSQGKTERFVVRQRKEWMRAIRGS